MAESSLPRHGFAVVTKRGRVMHFAESKEIHPKACARFRRDPQCDRGQTWCMCRFMLSEHHPATLGLEVERFEASDGTEILYYHPRARKKTGIISPEDS